MTPPAQKGAQVRIAGPYAPSTAGVYRVGTTRIWLLGTTPKGGAAYSDGHSNRSCFLPGGGAGTGRQLYQAPPTTATIATAARIRPIIPPSWRAAPAAGSGNAPAPASAIRAPVGSRSRRPRN